MEEKEFEQIDWKEQILENFDAGKIHDEWFDSYDWQYVNTMAITLSQCRMIEKILNEHSEILSETNKKVLSRVLRNGEYKESDRETLNRVRKLYLKLIK